MNPNVSLKRPWITTTSMRSFIRDPPTTNSISESRFQNNQIVLKTRLLGMTYICFQIYNYTIGCHPPRNIEQKVASKHNGKDKEWKHIYISVYTGIYGTP